MPLGFLAEAQDHIFNNIKLHYWNVTKKWDRDQAGYKLSCLDTSQKEKYLTKDCYKRGAGWGTVSWSVKWKLLDNERSGDRRYLSVSEQNYEKGVRDIRQQTMYCTLRLDCAGDQLAWRISRFVTLHVTFRTANENCDMGEATAEGEQW